MARAFAEFIRNFKPNTTSKLVAWLIFAKPILQYIFDFINAVSNLDFAISARGNPRIIAVWNFLNSPFGNICFSVFGLLLLLYQGWHWSKSAEHSRPKSVQATGTVDNSPETVIANLNTQHQSELLALKAQYSKDLLGREQAFDELKRKHDTLQDRLNGWEIYAWLVGLAETQARDINDYVQLERIERGDVRLHSMEGVPYIKFHFYISNRSVFDIVIELQSSSSERYIVFASELALREKYLGIPSDVLHIPSNKEGCLTIEQRLDNPEAHQISRREGQDTATFSFNRLVLTIKGSGQHPFVEPKRLAVGLGITLNGTPFKD